MLFLDEAHRADRVTHNSASAGVVASFLYECRLQAGTSWRIMAKAAEEAAVANGWRRRMPVGDAGDHRWTRNCGINVRLPETEARFMRRARVSHATTHTLATKIGGLCGDSSNRWTANLRKLTNLRRRGCPREGSRTGDRKVSETSHFDIGNRLFFEGASRSDFRGCGVGARRQRRWDDETAQRIRK